MESPEMTGEAISARKPATIRNVSHRDTLRVGQFERGLLDPQSADGFGKTLSAFELTV